MNSTEDDTYKMVKGLTQDEALSIFFDVYIQFTEQMGKTIGDVPLNVVKPLVNVELKPYGWSYDKLFGIILNDIS